MLGRGSWRIIRVSSLLLLISVVGFADAAHRDLVFVSGGTFTIGYTGSNTGSSRERVFRDFPPHQVTVRDFLVSKYEVTQDEFETVMGRNPSHFRGAKRPVENVTWFEAVEYCNRLSEKEGLTSCYSIGEPDVSCDFSANGYRLLTEAEWEYAARGGHLSGVDYMYAGSNNADEVAWIDVNSGGATHDVGRKKPNELGLFDLSGNVSEWCWDWYAEYTPEAREYPTGPVTGTHRVERGCNWRFPEDVCQNTRRHFVPPSESYQRLGFRVGRTRH